MNDGLIPQRYAKALYKLAKDKGNAGAVYEEMKLVADAFRVNPDLNKVLANPFVSREDKEKLLISAAGGAVEDDYRSFVKLILEHDREQFAYEMALAFRDIYRRENKISSVNITTAAQLSDAQLDKIKKIVAGAFPDHTLEWNFNVNPDLIGGFVVDVDSSRLDASISNELEQLRTNLLSN